jgi:RHS repeat-associated protein
MIKPSNRASIRNISDYSPFGVQLTERTISGDGYRYGFMGFERDNEVKGNGNSNTTEFRQYDPRLGRWLSVDPKTHHEYSPYSAFDNNPIYYVDPEGADSEGENKDDLNKNELSETPSAESVPETESKSPPPPAFKDNYQKLLTDPVGKEYSESECEKLSTQFDGYTAMKKIKEENGKSTFELTTGYTARWNGAPDKGTVIMEKNQITINHKVNDKWVKEKVSVVKVSFNNGLGFYDSKNKKIESVVYIFENKAYVNVAGTMKPKFTLD